MQPAHLLDDAFSRLEQAASRAATSPHNDRRDPTAAQAIAGNYLKARVRLHGLMLVVENARNSVRSGVSESGKAWSNRMAAHYGEIAGTRGADGDPVDVFIGMFPESANVWVINQGWPDGGFDEHKVMLGFASAEQAREAYLGSFDRDWQGLQSMVPASIGQLTWWLKFGDVSRPFSQDQLPFDGTPAMQKTFWNADAQPAMPFNQLMYQLRTDDAAHGLLLDAASLDDMLSDPDIERMQQAMLDALVVQVSHMTRRMDQLLRVMQAAGGKVSATDYAISDPIRARGVMQVAVQFALSDGQAITVWFHNPDTTPGKITPLDELISWKWMLNKKDITIVVAPERGRDLDVREVARRIMRLAERNSEAFAKANGKLAEKVAALTALDGEIQALETRLGEVQTKIAVVKQGKADAEAQRARDIASLAKDMDKLQEMIERGKRTPAIGDVFGSGQPLQALMNQFDAMADQQRALRGETAVGLVSWDQWMALQEVKAARAANGGAGLDVSNSADYLRVLASPALQLAYQDATDALFTERIGAVRNALRALGWEGEDGGALARNGAGVDARIEHVGPGRNVAGVVWATAGNLKPTATYAIDGLRDDLSISPEELAGLLDGDVSPWSAAETEARRDGNWRALYTVLPFADKFRVAGATTLNPMSPSYLTAEEAETAAEAFFVTGEFPAPALEAAVEPVDDLLHSFPGQDGMEAQVRSRPDGKFGVLLRDVDADAVVPSITIVDTEERAIEKAKALVQPIEAEAQADPAPAPAARRGKRVTKKEANEASDALAWALDDLAGHTALEFSRASPDRLQRAVAAVEALIVRGWPDGVVPPANKLERAASVLERLAAAAGVAPDEVGRGDAWSYLSVKGLTEEQIDPILAQPTSVQQSGEFEVPRYTREYLDDEAAAALAAAAPASTTSEEPMIEIPAAPTANATELGQAARAAGIATSEQDEAFMAAFGNSQNEGDVAAAVDQWLAGWNAAAPAEPAASEPEPVSAAQVDPPSDLPAGWSESRPGGMATNADPVVGGIVDAEKVSGEWFVIFNAEGMQNLEGFATRAQAFAAMEAALAAAIPAAKPAPAPASEAPAVAEPPPAPAEDASTAADRAYLQSLVDGTGDLLAEDTFSRLEPMFTKYEGNADLMALLERAATAFGDAAQKAAQDALAKPA